MNITKEQLEDLYIDQGLTLKQCAEVFGIPLGGMSRRLKKLGITARKGKGGKIEVKCSRPGCAKSKMIYPSQKYKTSYCSNKCRIEHGAWQNWSGENNPNFKGKVTTGMKISGKWVECENCKKNIWRNSYRIKISKQFFCGTKCAGDWRRKHLSGENHPRHNQAEVACAWCGKIKTVKQSTYERNNRFFCGGSSNSECRRKWESKFLVGKANPNYCGGTPEKRKIRHRMAANMRKAIKQKKAGRSWETLVDYTMADLIKRLKTTIPEGYSWENDFVNGNNVLHIDHIIPMAAFNFDSPKHLDFKRCFALKNLQLLPAIENAAKSAKLTKSFQPSLMI